MADGGLARPPRPAHDPALLRRRDRRAASRNASATAWSSCSRLARARGPTGRRASGDRVLYRADLVPVRVGDRERVPRRIDRALDRQLGYYPLAMRLNLRHGFHRERMRPGHPNWMLDSTATGALPHWSTRRARDGALALQSRAATCRTSSTGACGAECGALVLSNVQPHARCRSSSARGASACPSSRTWRAGITPSARASSRRFCDAYVVQNDAMRDDLVALSRHPAERDRRHAAGRRRTSTHGGVRASEYERLLALVRARSVVARSSSSWGTRRRTRRSRISFVERLVEWWKAAGRRSSVAPLPAASARPGVARALRRGARTPTGVAVQEPSYTDFEVLATLLQHCDCVVANAGTILLDALVNDRPAVCVLYDEGAPPGESYASKNVIGEHYRELVGVERLLPRGVVRGGRRGHRARARAARRARGRAAAVSRVRSSARSTGVPAERVVDAIVTTVDRRSGPVSVSEKPAERRGARKPAPRAARSGGRRRARAAFSSTTANAASDSATSIGQPRGRRTAIAISPSRIHIHGRGNQRESWLRRSASCALPVRSGSASKRSCDFAADLARSADGPSGWSNSKCHSVGDVQTCRMLCPAARSRRPDRRDRLALGRRGQALAADDDGRRLRRVGEPPVPARRPGTAPSRARPRPSARRRARRCRDGRVRPRPRLRGGRGSRCPSRTPGPRAGTGPRARGSSLARRARRA